MEKYQNRLKGRSAKGGIRIFIGKAIHDIFVKRPKLNGKERKKERITEKIGKKETKRKTQRKEDNEK